MPLRRGKDEESGGHKGLIILETYGKLMLDSVPDARGFSFRTGRRLLSQGDALQKERRSLGGTWVVESIVRETRRVRVKARGSRSSSSMRRSS